MVRIRTNPLPSRPTSTAVALKWDDSYYVRTYELAKEGRCDKDIAAALGLDSATFKRYLTVKPALKDALDRARQVADGTFADYVYRHLPEDLKALYQEIVQLDEDGDPLRRIEAVLADQGERVKQHLFVHALVESDFDPSTALARLRIPKTDLDHWVRHDPEFGRLVEEVVFHKKNFVEAALFKLVKQGDKSAVVFANKTLNADRGYGNKVKVQHEGEVNVKGSVKLSDLLPIEERKRLIKVARARMEQNGAEDAEYEVRGG
jgi:hypothetical protein